MGQREHSLTARPSPPNAKQYTNGSKIPFTPKVADLYKQLFEQPQQNNIYPTGGRFYEKKILKLLIGSQPIIEGRSLICCERG